MVEINKPAYTDICDDTVSFETTCLICGEAVPCTDLIHTIKVCDKCKASVMQMRKELEKENTK